MNKKILLLSIAFLLVIFGAKAQLFSEDFESGSDGWTFVDYNDDNNNWQVLNASQIVPAFGQGSLLSYSWTQNSGAITPDNLAISPSINIPTSADNVFLKFDYQTNAGYPNEKYSIYITTSNTPSDIVNSTPVYTETVATGGEIQNRVIDLSSYIGENIYITFRHYDCNDELFLIIDNIEVKSLLENDISLDEVYTNPFILINQDDFLTLSITNEGYNTINSALVNWSDGNTDHSEEISVAIEPNETVEVQHPIPLNFSYVFTADIQVTVEEVNNSNDNDPSNNSANTSTKIISQDAGKKVLVEEGTGTWCGWCPRGFVAMEESEENYPDSFIGIAVHAGANGAPDPMQNTDYLIAANFNSFPGMNVDRMILGSGVSSEAMEYYIERISSIPNPVDIEITPSINGNEISAIANTTFYTNFEDEDLRMAAIIIEDNVTGTSSGYAQTNYYSGGGQGPMAGWEDLANPVPASEMVYDHVGRALLGGYNGVEGSISSNLNDGDTNSYTFNYSVPQEYDISNLSIVVLVIDNSTGQIINAEKSSLGNLSTSSTTALKNTINLYPNPASETVYLSVDKGGEYKIRIYDLSGKVVLKKDPEILTSNDSMEINISKLSQGTYILSLEGQKQSFNKQLIIK